MSSEKGLFLVQCHIIKKALGANGGDHKAKSGSVGRHGRQKSCFQYFGVAPAGTETEEPSLPRYVLKRFSTRRRMTSLPSSDLSGGVCRQSTEPPTTYERRRSSTGRWRSLPGTSVLYSVHKFVARAEQ